MPTRNKDLSKEIGKRIALQRKKRGMTQEQAAECAGLSQQFLACLERGTKGLGQDSIIKLSRALDVSTDYLLKGTMLPEEADYVSSLLSSMDERQRKNTIEIVERVLTACGHELPEK